MKKILFITKISQFIGAGHLFRSRALAENLKYHKTFNVLVGPNKNLETKNDKRIFDEWYEGNLDQNINTYIKIFLKKHNFDFVILDYLNISFKTEQILYKQKIKYLIFDRGVKNFFLANIIINMNPLSHSSFYKSRLLARHKQYLCLGLKFSIIRKEFKNIGSNLKKININKPIFYLSLGGGDTRSIICKIIEAIKKLFHKSEINIITSSLNKELIKIKKYSAKYRNINVYINEKNPYRILKKSNIAIVNGGMTAIETLKSGIPFVIVSTAANQKPLSQALDKKGIAQYSGHSNKVSIKKIKISINNTVLNYYKYHKKLIKYNYQINSDNVIKYILKII